MKPSPRPARCRLFWPSQFTHDRSAQFFLDADCTGFGWPPTLHEPDKNANQALGRPRR